MRIWSHTDKIARNMMKPINTSAISIMSAYTFLWGVWLAAPWDIFSRAPLYSFISRIFPETVWGLIAIVIGIIMAHGVITDRYRFLLRGALSGFYFWFVISMGYFIGDWHGTGGITAGMISAYCGFIVMNLRANKEKLAS